MCTAFSFADAAFAATRIRAGGEHSDRRTGNFAAALFVHDTSRALDPHLHTHCIVFNATFDASENCWKALQNYELLRARKFAENAMDSMGFLFASDRVKLTVDDCVAIYEKSYR